MATECPGAGARNIDQHHVDRFHCRMPSIPDEWMNVRAFQSLLIGKQPLQTAKGFVGAKHSSGNARKLQRLSSGRRAQISDSRTWRHVDISRDQRRSGILHEEQSLLECTQISKGYSTGNRDTVAHVRSLGDVDAGCFHRRFQLLAHNTIGTNDDWRFSVVQRQQAFGVLLAVALDPARDQPPRMRVLERQRVDRIAGPCREKIFTFAIGAAEHRVDELAGAESVTALRQLHRLRDCRVSRNASHEQQLVYAQPQQVDDIRIEPDESAAHTLGENGIDCRAMTQHPIHQLSRPTAVARVEGRDAALERLIEKFSATQIDANLRRDRSCSGYTTGSDERVHEPIIPVVGDDGTATSRFGIRPARYALRPDSTAAFIATAIRTGSCAAAIPVFIRIPSTPCSITMHASDAVPTPASTITGTESRCLIVRIA